jgi:hypothetical protein
VAQPSARAASFAPSQSFNAHSQQATIASADFDVDGDIDLIVGNTFPENGVTLLLNDGTGAFSALPVIPLGVPRGIVADDLDGDGDPDAAVALVVDDAVQILENDGGILVPLEPVIPVGDAPTAIDSADLDGDGDLDLAVANRQSEDVTVLRNDGGLTFTPVGSFPTERDQADIVAADFDGDGLPDLAVTLQSDHEVMVLINDPPGAAPAGSFTAVDPPVSVGGTETFAIDAGDLDGDGDIDLVTASFETPAVDVLLNDGTGTFTLAQTVSSLQQFDVVVADLDRDGDLDVATTARQDQAILVYTNDGTGTLSAPESFPTADPSPFQLTAADLDGDGDQDLAVAHSFSVPNITVLLNTTPAPPPGAPETVTADLPPGGSLTTGTDATSDDPVETTVISPVGGTVSIEETVASTPDPSGFIVFDTSVEITVSGGPADPADPYVLIFRIHESLIPDGVDPADIRPMRDGDPVPLCTTPGVADPATCLDGPPQLVGDEVVLRVLTVQASTWTFFVAAPGGGDSDDGDDPYDTYDDDPGDPGFDFETPFDGAGDPGEPQSDVPADMAATGDTAGAQPGADGSAGVGSGGIGAMGGDQLATDEAVAEPVWLDQLPRTGLNVVVASLAGGILLVLGGGLRVGSRRRRTAE